MAITSFEVASTFAVVDRASAVIAKIGRAVADLDKAVMSAQANLAKLGDFQFTKVNAAVNKLTQQFSALADKADASIGSMTSATDAATASTRALAAEWRSVQAATRAAASAAATAATAAGNLGAAPTGIRARAARAAERRGELPVSREPTVVGGFRVNGGGLVGQSIIAGVTYGAYEEAMVEHYANQAAFVAQDGGGVPDDATIKRREAEFTNAVKNAAQISGFSPKVMAKSALAEIYQLAPMPWEQRMKLMPSLLEFAAGEAQLKGVDPKDTMAAIINAAHDEGVYDVAGIEKEANRFAAAATMTHSSISSLVRAYGYTSGLKQLGYSPDQLLGLTTALMRGPGMNTKSGSWTNALLTRALPGSTTQSKKAFQAHEAALKALGLEDDSGHLKFLRDDGTPDAIKLVQLTAEALQKMEPAKRAGPLKALFGEQGARAEEYFSNPEVLKQLQQVPDFLKNFKGGKALFEQAMRNDPVVQITSEFQTLTTTLMSIGKTVLPPVTIALKGFAEGLKILEGILGAGLLGRITSMGIGAGIGAKVGGPVGAVAGAAGSEFLRDLAPGGGGILPGLPSIGDDIKGLHDWLKGWWNSKAKDDGATDKNTDETKKNTDQLQKLNGLLNPTSYTGGAVFQPAVYEGPGGFVTRDGVTVPAANAATNPMGTFGVYNGGPGSGPDPRGLVPYIRAQAIANGINPDVAVRVARSEGLEGFVGDNGTSFGAFQLHRGGLADQFIRDTGLNPADPKNEKATIDWTMKWLAKNRTWSPWMGARAHGITGSMGIGDIGANAAAANAAVGMHFNYFQRLGLQPNQVPLTTVQTPFGPIKVAQAAAGDFSGFYKALADAGAPIHNLGSYNLRMKRGHGGHGWSSHAYGAATDIDDAASLPADMRSWIAGHQQQWHDALSSHHMLWGQSFGDGPHIEWGGPGSPGHDSPGTDTASPAIAPHRGTTPIIIHTNLQLDGRTVAKNTMKHIAREGNAPARGGRLPDNLITRPLTV